MAKKPESWLLVGRWAFIVGLILAIILGIVPFGAYSSVAVSILVIIGLIVGLLNITMKESTPFLISAVVLVIVAGFGSAALANVQYIGTYLRNILQTLLMLIVPATIIVCLKEIYLFAER